MAAENPIPKNPASHLHVLNLIVALIAGLISVVGGVYSLKTNVFGHKPGGLQGIILDEAIAKPLWMVPVEISDSNGVIVANVNTDQTGHYAVKPIKEGDYVIKVSAQRHQLQTRKVRVDAGLDSTLNFDLVPEAVPVVSPEPVQVPRQFPSVQNSGGSAQRAVPETSPGMYAGAGSPDAAYSSGPSQQPRRRRRWNQANPPLSSQDGSSMDGNAGQNSSGSTSLNSLVTQAGGQLLQQWLSKKSGSSGQ